MCQGRNIPIARIKRLEKYIPEMFDLMNWNGVRNNYRDFMAARKPKPA